MVSRSKTKRILTPAISTLCSPWMKVQIFIVGRLVDSPRESGYDSEKMLIGPDFMMYSERHSTQHHSVNHYGLFI